MQPLQPKSLAPVATTPRRLLGFDVENKGGSYWFDGKMTALVNAIAWKWTDQKKMTCLVKLPTGLWEDQETGTQMPPAIAMVIIRDQFARADAVMGHNIIKHDLPLVNAMMLREELPPLQPVTAIDFHPAYPKRKDMSISLESLLELYKCPMRKLHLSLRDWEHINDFPMDWAEKWKPLLVKRVTTDVEGQEWLYFKLKSLGLCSRETKWKATK